MSEFQKYLKYKLKYLSLKNLVGGDPTKNCNLFQKELPTVCEPAANMFYHGTDLAVYLILLLNSYMRGKNEVDFPRILDINNNIIYL